MEKGTRPKFIKRPSMLKDRVIKFVQFKDRLQHSNQYLVAQLESSILKLKEKTDNIEDEECVLESMKFGSQVLELASEKAYDHLVVNEIMPSYDKIFGYQDPIMVSIPENSSPVEHETHKGDSMFQMLQDVFGLIGEHVDMDIDRRRHIEGNEEGSSEQCVEGYSLEEKCSEVKHLAARLTYPVPIASWPKVVVNQFSRIAQNDRCMFFGNVTLGSSVSLKELRDLYHVVVLAYGAESDRVLGVPGEDLEGIYSAREFVWWYNGHPDCRNLIPDLQSTDTAVILGQVTLQVFLD
ncbi:hypothetical protein Ancab_004610 [Ancistrocladus abbreviatus]